MKCLLIILMAPAYFGLYACASRGPFDDLSRGRNFDISSVSASSQDHRTEKPIDDGGIDGLDDDADVEAFVRRALENNPELLAARLKVERMAARIPQAKRLDDPMFSVSPVGEMAETAAGQVGLMTSISQKLPLPAKLETRGDIATQDIVIAAAEYEQAKQRVVSDVRRAYWRYYFADRAIALTAESHTLLEQFREIADTRFRAGQAGQQDVLRVNTEIATVDSQIIELRQRQTVAKAMLNQLMNRRPTAALPSPQRIELSEVDESLDELLREAGAKNPEMEAARARIEQFRHRLKLAKLDDWPDLTVGLTYNAVDDDGLAMSANGDDQWWLTFGINIPIWREPREAARAEAVRGIGESAGLLNDTHNRVTFRVQDALSRVESQRQLTKVFAEQIIPQAQQTLEVSVTEYTAGRADFLDVIENWRKLLSYELLQEQNLAGFHQAMAELDEAIGRAPTENAPQPNLEVIP